jgi:hypothetical protein
MDYTAVNMRTSVTLVLLVLAAANLYSPEMQELVDRHTEMMAKMLAVRDSAVTNDDCLVTPNEYGRILKGIIAVSSGSEGNERVEKVVDEFVLTLPELMDPTDIMLELGTGIFGQMLHRNLLSTVLTH